MRRADPTRGLSGAILAAAYIAAAVFTGVVIVVAIYRLAGA